MQRYYSNIYWHFTGSPSDVDWKKIKKPKELKDYPPKTIKDTYETLETILLSKTLKATSAEKVSSTEETAPFCCVCDIPLKDLDYHMKYYGKIAIGFNHKAIHGNFNPVLYIDPEHMPYINHSVSLEDGSKSLINLIKHTNFGVERGESFYGEREWRYIGDYRFNESDVEVIIVPKDFKDKLIHFLEQNHYDDTTVLTWELIQLL
ncbi:abortive infection system antitoxin AbiGi family protein [Alteribacillus bidgolensis]|uniref:Putative abortive phage resistance protein AbiGi, antitoxin n=1 Tax=Alteribacillus bidgolensis TaxID=930129 RepID=A0A1G8FUJ9_9BACI|nr:abortive infection system antitoxin AbiGi family protein [Alteribacillus bidgolensis]SDH85819.1 Putative abortive phage resistance protein AbiGi, antitoxin [Alteribacillus bidgolensis]